MLLIAANLRATITGVGPLLTQIADDLGTSEAALGALAAVPLIAFAVVSPFAHGLSARFGMPRVVLWSLLLMAVGTIWRSIPGSAVNLWLGTALIGAAIAIANVLMPAVIKRDFGERITVVTAAFTALLAGMGAVASGVVVPISHVQTPAGDFGWQGALLWTGALLPFAITAWLLSLRSRPRDGGSPARRPRSGIWTDPVAWQVLLYMGLQSSIFYMLVTWFAPIAHSLGRSEVVAGIDVMVYQLCAIAGSLTIPLLLRGRMQRVGPAAIPVLSFVGILGLIAVPDLFLLWVVLCGLASGASLGVSLSLFSLRARTHEGASALSGMAQSGGYLIAAAGPVAFGALLSVSGGWIAPLVLVGLVIIGQLVVGVLVGRDRHVLEPR